MAVRIGRPVVSVLPSRPRIHLHDRDISSRGRGRAERKHQPGHETSARRDSSPALARPRGEAPQSHVAPFSRGLSLHRFVVALRLRGFLVAAGPSWTSSWTPGSFPRLVVSRRSRLSAASNYRVAPSGPVVHARPQLAPLRPPLAGQCVSRLDKRRWSCSSTVPHVLTAAYLTRCCTK